MTEQNNTTEQRSQPVASPDATPKTTQGTISGTTPAKETTGEPSPSLSPPVPLSNGALRSLVRDGSISYDAYEAALRFLGVRPGPREWNIFWHNMLSICGALFLASGIIFFFAWNWTGMHHFTKFAIIGGVLTGCVLLALWRGLDSLPGRLALLLATLSVGPLLAVFGQEYQSGADVWELFRAWAIVIFPFALVGRQAALWLIFWVVASGCWFLYTSSLPMLSYYGLPGLPEFFLAQALGIAAWEAALKRWGKTPEHAWLNAAWLTRLMVFSAGGALTMSLIRLIFEFHYDEYSESWFLPERATILCLYALSLAVGWYWYRHKRRDLFMLACGVFSIVSLLVALLIKTELFDVDAGSLLLWGLILAGLTAGGGHLLRRWQRDIENDEHEEQEREAGALVSGNGSGDAYGSAADNSAASTTRRTVKTGFFDRFRAKVGWSELWEHLRALQLLSVEDTPRVIPCESQPWYISVMLAFGGWISGLFLIGFLAFLLFETLNISYEMEVSLLVGGLIFLGIAWALLQRGGMFAEQFGIAMATAGISCVGAAIIWLNRGTAVPCLLISLVIAATYPVMHSGVYRFLAAMTAPVFFIWGLDSLIWQNFNYDTFAVSWLRLALMAVCFTLICLALTWSWLNERRWLNSRNNIIAPLLHGSYCSVLAALLCSIALKSEVFINEGLFFVVSSRSIGLGAGVGLIYLGFKLTSGISRANPVRWLYLGLALLGLLFGWYLPGVSVALFGLALSRYLGDKVTMGLTCFALFAYIFYYYYNLQTTLLHKSMTLMVTGLILLLAGYTLRRVFGADADASTAGGSHA